MFTTIPLVHSLLTKQDKYRILENITWGLIWDLKCIMRFLFSLEWICYCKSQKKNWKNFLNHQLITQIKISLIGATQVELRAAIFHISHRLKPVQLPKLLRSQQLHCTTVKNPGTGDQQCNWHPVTGDQQCNLQCNQLPHTQLYIGKSNMTSHLPTFLHC